MIGWLEASEKFLGQNFNVEQYPAKFQLTRIAYRESNTWGCVDMEFFRVFILIAHERAQRTSEMSS